MKVGTIEDGKITRSSRGTPQGSNISPILANVYLHFALDLWLHAWRQKKATGDVVAIRYADDAILGFQHEHEARAFLQDLQVRLRKFDLELHPEKTKLIRFGRYAEQQCKERGKRRPDTFGFLGFTHYCTRSSDKAQFFVGRKSISKRMRSQLQEIKTELRRRLHAPLAETGAWLSRVLKGHLNYYAVPGNRPCLSWFFWSVARIWMRMLRRRSQRARMSWAKFNRRCRRFFLAITIRHPLPYARFDANTRGRSLVR